MKYNRIIVDESVSKATFNRFVVSFNIDSPKMKNPTLYLKEKSLNQYEKLFNDLYNVLPNIEFIPSEKGFFIERLRKKLDNLSRNKSNEIVSGKIENIIKNVENFHSEITPYDNKKRE